MPWAVRRRASAVGSTKAGQCRGQYEGRPVPWAVRRQASAMCSTKAAQCPCSGGPSRFEVAARSRTPGRCAPSVKRTRTRTHARIPHRERLVHSRARSQKLALIPTHGARTHMHARTRLLRASCRRRRRGTQWARPGYDRPARAQGSGGAVFVENGELEFDGVAISDTSAVLLAHGGPWLARATWPRRTSGACRFTAALCTWKMAPSRSEAEAQSRAPQRWACASRTMPMHACASSRMQTVARSDTHASARPRR